MKDTTYLLLFFTIKVLILTDLTCDSLESASSLWRRTFRIREKKLSFPSFQHIIQFRAYKQIYIQISIYIYICVFISILIFIYTEKFVYICKYACLKYMIFQNCHFYYLNKCDYFFQENMMKLYFVSGNLEKILMKEKVYFFYNIDVEIKVKNFL